MTEHSATPPAHADVEPCLARELEAIAHEPLLPIEKKLIVGSLVLGAVLLGLLLWISTTFFPVDAARWRGAPGAGKAAARPDAAAPSQAR